MTEEQLNLLTAEQLDAMLQERRNERSATLTLHTAATGHQVSMYPYSFSADFGRISVRIETIAGIEWTNGLRHLAMKVPGVSDIKQRAHQKNEQWRMFDIEVPLKEEEASTTINRVMLLLIQKLEEYKMIAKHER